MVSRSRSDCHGKINDFDAAPWRRDLLLITEDSLMNQDILKKAYAVIGEFTPMRSDCGALCEAACCESDEDGQGGVYLFPGEEEIEMPWGKVERDDFGPMLVCEDWCDRDQRPFACRIFPLTPVKNAEGKWTVRMDARARAMCPLVRSGVKGLDPDFVKGVIKALRLIAKDPEGEAFLEKWVALEEQYRFVL